MRNKLLKGLAIGFCATLAMGLVACGDGGGGGGDNGNLNGGKALNYKLLEDGTYGVSVGECYDVPEITIPAKYNGKKVTTIMRNFFEVNKKVLDTTYQGDVTLQEKDIVTYSIIISEGVTTLEAGAFNVHSLKRLELAKSVVNFGDSSLAWSQAPQGLVEIYNKGNLPLTNEDTLGDYAWLGRLAEHIYTDSADRKVTMDENGIVTYQDLEGKKALLDYCGTESVFNVPNDIDYIFESACWAVPCFKEINIPATCKSVEDYAFSYCSNVEVINISEGVEKIGYSFMYLDNFIYANVPESVTSLDSYAFNAQVYRGVVCYYGVTSDYNTPNHSREKLYDVKSVEKTTDGFVYAVRSEDVVLLKYFGNASELVIADTYKEKPVTYIYHRACAENDDITKLTVGNNVTEIGNYAFSRCDNLVEVILSDSVKGVAYGGFEDCENLVKLTIGANVQNMHYGSAAFSGCEKITEVYNRSPYPRALNDLLACGGVEPENIYTEGTSKITVENGFVLYTNGDVCMVANYIGTEKDVVVPDKVTEIRKIAFEHKKITTLTVGNGVTKIGKGACNGCGTLTTVTLGNNVKIIEASAFNSCANLTSVTLPASLEKLESAAFYSPKLKEINYLGTTTQWAAIEKFEQRQTWEGHSWYNYAVLEKVICSDGEVTP